MVKFYKPDTESSLKDYQNACFEVLRRLVHFLDDNNIEYWLDGGSILGLIRHGDFIPWDDDIDIAMDEKNYSLFRSLAKTGLPGNLSFIDEGSGHMQKGFCKVLMSEYEMISPIQGAEYFVYGAYVDVFLMVEYPILPASAKKIFLKKGMQVYSAREIGKYSVSLKNALKMLIYILAVGIIDLIWKLLPKSNNLANPLGLNVYSMLHDKDNLFPLQKVKWRDLEVKVPYNCDGYIKELYGKNYMQLPPPEKQTTHSVKILKN